MQVQPAPPSSAISVSLFLSFPPSSIALPTTRPFFAPLLANAARVVGYRVHVQQSHIRRAFSAHLETRFSFSFFLSLWLFVRSSFLQFATSAWSPTGSGCLPPPAFALNAALAAYRILLFCQSGRSSLFFVDFRGRFALLNFSSFRGKTCFCSPSIVRRNEG